MRWAQEQRMLWIDGRLNTHGFIQRKHLEEQFRISTQQASIDLNTFMRLKPGRMTYDKTAKRYVRAAQQENVT